jgi:putative oxidoreductase
MKIVVLIARILLGLIFVVFGANLIHPFIPMPPVPPGPLKDFDSALFVTHYIVVIGFFQFLGGLLLLINRYVPLGLVILAAEIVNILTTHILVMHGEGLFPVPILVVLLWFLIFWRVRSSFQGLFEARGCA